MPIPVTMEKVRSEMARVANLAGGATDNAVARFDGATGLLLQNSVMIVDDAGAVSGVTLAATSLSPVTSDRLIGRDTAGSGASEQLTVGGGIEFTGSGGIQRSALTGDVTATAGSGTTTIANDAVTTVKILNANVTAAKMVNAGVFTGDATTTFPALTIGNNAISDAKLRDSAAVSVIGRSANSSGDPADIAASANDRVLARTSDAVGFVQVTNGMLPADVVALTNIADQANNTVLGNIAGSSASPTALTVANIRTLLGHLTAVKTTDETIATDSTYGDDAALTLAVAASTNYIVTGLILFQSDVTPDFKYEWGGPTGAIPLLFMGGGRDGSSVAAFFDRTTTLNESTACLVANTNIYGLSVSGRLAVDTTAGTFAFRWAQNTSDAANTSVLAGSWLRLEAY